jgi:hypothetical protein
MYSTKQLNCDVFNKQLDVFNKQLDVFNKQLDVNCKLDILSRLERHNLVRVSKISFVY